MTNDFFKKYPFSETLEYIFNQVEKVALGNSKNDTSISGNGKSLSQVLRDRNR